MDYDITYSGEPYVLEGYCDSNWITNEEKNSSTSSWVFVYGGGSITWSSKKQICIVDSTMFAKFILLALAVNEEKWLRNLMFEVYFCYQSQYHCWKFICATALGRVYNDKIRKNCS